MSRRPAVVGSTGRRDSVRLPDLGPRGEGWFVAQLVVFVAIGLAGFAGPAWDGLARSVGLAAGAVIILAGALLAVRGVLDLGASLTVFPRPRPGAALVRSGSYRLARHPIYGGLILGALGWGLATASPLALAGSVGFAVFFDIKSRREEAWLVEQFAEYDAYRRRTARLLPWVY